MSSKKATGKTPKEVEKRMQNEPPSIDQIVAEVDASFARKAGDFEDHDSDRSSSSSSEGGGSSSDDNSFSGDETSEDDEKTPITKKEKPSPSRKEEILRTQLTIESNSLYSKI